MKRMLTISLIAALLPTIVMAQDAQPTQDGQEQPRRMRGQGGPGFGGPGGPGFGGRMSGRMFERVVEDLNLDDEQKAQFETIVEPVRERMRQAGEQWQQVRALEESGETEQAQTLRRSLMEQMGRGEAMETAFAQLEPILRPEQLEKFDDMRDRFDRDRESRDNMRKIAEELPTQLNLDETQRQQFDEMAAAGREKMGEQWRAMRPMFEEMRTAREAGDTARVAELQAQMEAQRPDMNAAYAEFLTQVEGILNDEQKQTLAAFRDETGIGMAADSTAAGDGKSIDPREMLKLVKRLRLSDEQKDQFKQIEKDAMGAYKDARRDAAAKAALSDQLRGQIGEMLDDTQKQRFESLIERSAKRSRR